MPVNLGVRLKCNSNAGDTRLMNPGYLYILSNESMPGMVKIGRTERQPEVRSQELRTTGVPQPFKLEHFVFVDDCVSAELEIHVLLEHKGFRTSPDREFFGIPVAEAIEVVDWLTSKKESTRPDFRNSTDLAAMASSVRLPVGNKQIDRDEAELLAERLSKIARRGYPEGLRACADLFDVNCPASLLFKSYWREYLVLARQEALARPIASGGDNSRQRVGRDTAEYVHRCHNRRWLEDEDFRYIREFLVSGDRFQYEGYISEVQRYKLPAAIAEKALSV